MHTIKANGMQLVIYYQRSFEDIHEKPHITGWRGVDDDGTPIRRWALYSLRGRQSRVRCTLYVELKEAIRQAKRIAEYNQGADRFMRRRHRNRSE